MNIDQIKVNLNQVENHIFFDSLYRLDVEELQRQKANVEKLIESFLWLSFTGLDVVELEDIRFRLIETSVNLEIRIKEQLREDNTADIKKLKSLYRIA